MPVNEQQARAITFLAIAARPIGAPRWDEAGIFANVMKVADRAVGAVTIAVIQAAEDRQALSPGVIPKPGPHWRDPASAPVVERTPYDPRTHCGVCSQPEPSCRARADHEFEPAARKRDYSSTAEHVARAKAALTETRTWPATPHPTHQPTRTTRAADVEEPVDG